MSTMKTLTINGVKYDVTPVVPATSVTLLERAWVDEGEGHSQVVEIPGVTPSTKVDLQPTAEQLVEFHDKILAFVAENDGGVVTVYAIGHRPTGDHTIQTTLTEVEGTGKIRGNTVGTTMPNPDWNQTDPTKADYIKNKPTYAELGAAPSGYGLGTTATDISGQNLVTATVGKSGFYRGLNVTHAPDSDWWRFIVNAGIANSIILALDNYGNVCYLANVSNSATSITWNKVYTDKNKPTAEEVGAAPAKLVDNFYTATGTEEDLLGIINSVYSSMPDRSVRYVMISFKDFHPTLGGSSYIFRLWRCYGDYGTLEATSYSGGSLRRNRTANTWQPWEWVNPPLSLGVVYRTTERWNGKVVYAKMVDFGMLPNSTSKAMYVDDGITDFVRVDGDIEGTLVSLATASFIKEISIINGNSLQIITNTDVSAMYTSPVVYYCKG